MKQTIYSTIHIFYIVCILIIYIGLIYFYMTMTTNTNITESFQTTTTTTTTTNTSLLNILPIRATMPLVEYCIKCSYNSAFDGSNISTETIVTILQKGVRFLDLEIYYINDIPVVGYSIDPTFINLKSKNSISLSKIFIKILSTAFTSIHCTNYMDPLFIQLRIKSNDLNNVYKAVASVISSCFDETNKLYIDTTTHRPIPVNETTILSDINSKIIFIIDKTINPDYANYTTCYDNSPSCHDLTQYINMISGGNTLRVSTFGTILTQHTTPPVIMDDFKTTNASILYLAIPDPILNVKNPLMFDYLLNYGIQNIAFQFWNNDQNLVIYESLFDEHKTAFVPFAYALHYCKQMQHNMKNGFKII